MKIFLKPYRCSLIAFSLVLILFILVLLDATRAATLPFRRYLTYVGPINLAGTIRLTLTDNKSEVHLSQGPSNHQYLVLTGQPVYISGFTKDDIPDWITSKPVIVPLRESRHTRLVITDNGFMIFSSFIDAKLNQILDVNATRVLSMLWSDIKHNLFIKSAEVKFLQNEILIHAKDTMDISHYILISSHGVFNLNNYEVSPLFLERLGQNELVFEYEQKNVRIKQTDNQSEITGKRLFVISHFLTQQNGWQYSRTDLYYKKSPNVVTIKPLLIPISASLDNMIQGFVNAAEIRLVSKQKKFDFVVAVSEVAFQDSIHQAFTLSPKQEDIKLPQILSLTKLLLKKYSDFSLLILDSQWEKQIAHTGLPYQVNNRRIIVDVRSLRQASACRIHLR